MKYNLSYRWDTIGQPLITQAFSTIEDAESAKSKLGMHLYNANISTSPIDAAPAVGEKVYTYNN